MKKTFNLWVRSHPTLKKLIMELKIAFLIILISVSNIFATPSYSQMAKVTLDLKNTTIEQVMDKIESQSEFYFIFNQKQIDVNRVVDIQVENKLISDILPELFKGTNVNYAVFDRKILLTTDPLEIGKMSSSSVSVLQQKQITGTIKDASTGEALVGVNIVVEGTSIGVISDINGKFSISVPDANSVLQISYIGYATKKIPLNGMNAIDITLVSDVTALADVVVVGYGSVKKTDLTGSVSSVKTKDLLQMPTQRVDQALQGRSSGVYILNTDGAPGGTTMIRIRGLNSIMGGNDPLIVIDGLQGGSLNSLNPNDIASMEVLKDASSTAIYGSRGANGVILITTKLGRTGKPVIDFGYNVSFQRLAHKLPSMSAADYATTYNAFKMTQTGQGNIPTPQFSDAQIADWAKNGGTDWQDVVYKTGLIQNYNFGISGATEKLKYMISSNYMTDKGILVNSNYNRASLRANFSADITNWVDFGLNSDFTKETYKSPIFRGGDNVAMVVENALEWDATQPVYDANGNYATHAPGYGASDTWNPLASAMEPIIDNPSYKTNANAYLNFKPLKGLSLKIMGGAMFTNSYLRDYYDTKTFSGKAANGVAHVNESILERYQNTNILTYDNTIGIHHLTFTGVVEQISETFKGSTIQAKDFLVEELNFNNLAGAKLFSINSSRSDRTLLSYMGRLNYGLKNRYLATFTYRADASSVFGKDNKWGYFPSGSLAWRASEEEFLKNVSAISDLKLRASYGITGNQGIAPYQSLARLGSGSGYNYPWNGQSSTDIGFGLAGLANPNLKWEATSQTDFGADVSLFKGRLTATVDVYKKVTKDLLMNRTLPSYVGIGSVLDNIGSIENKGLEIMVGGDPMVGIVKWNTSFNYTMNRNKILNLGGDLRGGWDDQPWAVGTPFDLINGWKFLGIWGTDQDAEARSYGQLPGDPHYADLSGPNGVPDGKVDVYDRTTIGHGYPKFTFGWNNTFSYRQFELSFLFVGSYGNDLLNVTRVRRELPGYGDDPILMDYWTPTNQNTKQPGLIDQKYREDQHLVNTYQIPNLSWSSSRWIEDASYIRLSSVTLSYSFNQQTLRSIGFQKARCYFSGSNLLTLTKYTGYDPEVSLNSTGGGIGWDYCIYPKARIYTFGIDLTF